MKNSTSCNLIIALVSTCSILSSSGVFSQTTSWDVTGNSGIGLSNFIGTTDNAPLNFRTNNVNRIGISSSGDITFNGLSGSGIGLMMHDANGKVLSLPMTGLGDKVLMDNGQFVPIGNFNTGWTLSGNKTLSNVPFVGINTNNPTEALTVNGNALVYGTLTTNGLNVLHKIEADTIKSGVRMNVNGTLVLGEDGGYNGIASNNDELRLNSKPGLDRNVIISANNNGNVGIGVVNPQEKLELAGNARIYGDMILPQLGTASNLDDQVLFITDEGRIVRGGFPADFIDASYNLACKNDLPRWANNGPSILYTGILPNCPARVGINTSMPSHELEVIGNVRINSRLGIGTNTPIPQAELDVNGLALVSNGLGIGLNQSFGQGYPGSLKLDVNGDARFYSNNNSNDYISLGYNTSNAILDMGGNGRLLINYYSGKDVVIGSTNHANGPSDLFVSGQIDACGRIRTTELIVETGWCDFVFAPDYQRMSLKEKEAYIQKFNHLPMIASGQEIENNGLKVAETMKGFVYNIENLTLDQIEMHKQLIEATKIMIEMKQRIGELEAEVKELKGEE
jgi:hypothetical protein